MSTPAQLRDAVERYMSRCHREGACLVADVRKYGDVWVGQKERHAAHRAVYTVKKGEIPEGFVIRHTCDRPQCVEPSHLIAGTHSQNVRDIYERNRRKGAWAHGEGHRDAQLTPAIVAELRTTAASSGLSLRELASQRGFSYSTVYSAVRGITWAHITDPAPLPPIRKSPRMPARQLAALRPDDCLAAMEMADDGAALADIAAALGVSRHTAFNLVRSGKEMAS